LEGRGVAAKVVDYDDKLRTRLFGFIRDWRQSIGYFVGKLEEEPPDELGADQGIFDCKDPLWQFFQARCWMENHAEA
jgi:hypothetical protein